MIETILFIVFALVAVFSAVMMVTRRNPVISALFLILNFFMIAGLYLLLKVQFIAIIQVLVYTGAIMVLFLFVIMLLNLKDEKKLSEQLTYKKITSVLLSVMLLFLLGTIVYLGFADKGISINPGAEKTGTAEFLGKELFTTYSFLVIAAGILLLAAIIGAVVLAKKRFP